MRWRDALITTINETKDKVKAELRRVRDNYPHAYEDALDDMYMEHGNLVMKEALAELEAESAAAFESFLEAARQAGDRILIDQLLDYPPESDLSRAARQVLIERRKAGLPASEVV